VTADEIHDRVVSTASAVFESDSQTIVAGSSIEQIPSWDSVAHLNFILALEQEFHCNFTDAEIEQLTSIPSIVRVLGAKA
jgi:acyl carrier protein